MNIYHMEHFNSSAMRLSRALIVCGVSSWGCRKFSSNIMDLDLVDLAEK